MTFCLLSPPLHCHKGNTITDLLNYQVFVLIGVPSLGTATDTRQVVDNIFAYIVSSHPGNKIFIKTLNVNNILNFFLSLSINGLLQVIYLIGTWN